MLVDFEIAAQTFLSLSFLSPVCACLGLWNPSSLAQSSLQSEQASLQPQSGGEKSLPNPFPRTSVWTEGLDWRSQHQTLQPVENLRTR